MVQISLQKRRAADTSVKGVLSVEINPAQNDHRMGTSLSSASPNTDMFHIVLDKVLQSPPHNSKPSVMASGVAIDNKIEQAMDLVKSHLMLAVREEVEELRLQIKQLLERNAQLEQENQILRSSASPEILAQLNALGHSSNS